MKEETLPFRGMVVHYDYNHPINGNILDIKDYLEDDFKGKFINSTLENNKVFLGEIYI